jgi:hypothetical protein
MLEKILLVFVLFLMANLIGWELREHKKKERKINGK